VAAKSIANQPTRVLGCRSKPAGFAPLQSGLDFRTNLWKAIFMSISMREMLEAGVHFGHHTRFWNPKMVS